MRWIFLRRLHQPVQRFHFLSNRNIQSSCKTFIYSPDVNVAKKNGLPIVALESAVITHGMPYPHNLETAIKVEDAVRKKGAVPATIGILNGQIHIGLNEEQLTTMAQSDSQRTVKCSCRDISTIVSRKLNGGTTVSSTMVIANLTGLPIMATGGIGGVHRGAEFTFDISADLMELGRTDVAVVCSGVKSILDIEKTLEYLETLGVPVIKIGNNDYFPAFYCSETTQKIKVPHRVSNSMEAANILNVQKAIGLQRGLVFAVPIPEEHSLDAEVIETAIIKAVENAKEQNITGKNVTPFLLKKLNEITCGQSLHANIALIENNAIVAAEIAVNLAESNNKNAAESNMPRGFLAQGRNPVVIGGAIMDTTLQVMESEIRDDGRTHAGRSREGCGGVGRNIANALISLGLNGTRLISVVSNDQPGKAIIKSLGEGGQTVEKLSNMNTARYTAIIDSKGECCFGVGEMEIFAQIKPSLVKKHQSIVENASLIIIDGNIPLDTIRCVIDVATSSKIPIWYEPTDIKKATKIFEASSRWQNILHFISPNKNELVAIGKYLGIRVPEHEEHLDVKEVKIIAEQVAEFVPAVITTLGSQGVLVVRKAMGSDPFYDRDSRLVVQKNTNSRLYPPILYNSDSLNAVCNVTGCGDCLTGGIIYGIHRNLSEETCLSLGLKAAALSLTSLDAVPSSLSILNDHVKAYQQ